MNERVMQFRIGMFVIVAGLVLTMLIVWFGESPALFRDHVFVVARYDEAPGVAEGIAVRKSGIRVGEVVSIAFDSRPNKPDGVLVTISLDRKYKIKAGSVPRVTRALIGDVGIDLMPGTGPGLMPTSSSPENAPIIEGSVSPDPSKALAAATEAFEKVGGTLKAIDDAANGIAKISNNAENLTTFLETWSTTGKRVSSAADSIDRFIRDNETEFKPTVTNLKEVSQRLNDALDPATRDALKSGVNQFAIASKRLTESLNSSAPLFKDLGAPVNSTPTTDFGQAVRRLNLMTADLNLLTKALKNPSGGLNTEGTLQKLITKPELYDNANRLVTSGTNAFEGLKPIIALLRIFADKISKDPSILARGALQR